MFLPRSATVQVWFECVSKVHKLEAWWLSGVMLTGDETYTRWEGGVRALGALPSKKINMVLFVSYS